MGEQDDRPTPDITMPSPEPHLPHVDADSASPVELNIPGAPRLPTIEERRKSITLKPGPGESPVPGEDPLITPIRNMVRAELGEHEEHERRIARELSDKVENQAKKVDEVEKAAKRERQELSDKIDRLTVAMDAVFDDKIGLPAYRTWIREDFKEAAISIADRFLEPVSKLITQMEQLQNMVQSHELLLKRVKIEELREQHDKLTATVEDVRRELEEVRAQLETLLPKEATATP